MNALGQNRRCCCYKLFEHGLALLQQLCFDYVMTKPFGKYSRDNDFYYQTPSRNKTDATLPVVANVVKISGRTAVARHLRNLLLGLAKRLNIPWNELDLIQKSQLRQIAAQMFNIEISQTQMLANQAAITPDQRTAFAADCAACDRLMRSAGISGSLPATPTPPTILRITPKPPRKTRPRGASQ